MKHQILISNLYKIISCKNNLSNYIYIINKTYITKKCLHHLQQLLFSFDVMSAYMLE